MSCNCNTVPAKSRRAAGSGVDVVASAMAVKIWRIVSPDRRAPDAARRAADDTITLIEQLNRRSMNEILALCAPASGRHFAAAMGDEIVRQSTDAAKMGRPFGVVWVGAAALTEFKVPALRVSLDGDILKWEADAVAAPAPTRNPGHHHNAHGHIESVLVIEDDESIQRMMRRAMSSLYPNATLTVVSSAGDAIDHIASATDGPDLILSDYDVVGSTGGDVLAFLQRSHPDLVDRFLFISGNPIVERLHAHFLMKPATRSQIAEAINRLPPHRSRGRW